MATAAFERGISRALLVLFFLGLVTAPALFVGRFLDSIHGGILHFLVMAYGAFPYGHYSFGDMMTLHACHDFLMLAVREDGRFLPSRGLHDHFIRTDAHFHA